MQVSIAKFAALTKTDVAERIETTWDRWLDFLVAEPADSFQGQMEHAGWSPAIFDPPKRLADNVRLVQALVLDYDKNAQWDVVHTLWAASFGAIHTTKSHTDSVHRVRVVLPLARAVSRDEYARIWRWAALRSTGCPVDEQTKDASRFWYDPSAPAGKWRGSRLTGAMIDPDAVLALVEPPKLRTVPAAPPRATDRVKRASAYLAKLPAAVSGDQGHTTTWNAVAAVMFGFDLTIDETRHLITSEYNPRCDPSWSEREIEHKLKDVCGRCTRERGYLLVDRPLLGASAPGAQPPPAPAASAELGPDVNWTSLLLVKKDQSVRKDYANTLVFVRYFPDYRGRWSMDMRAETPFFDGRPMPASMVHDLRAHAGARLGFTPSPSDVEAAIVKACEDRPFNPILQYLRSIDWDGEPRLASMARDFLGSDSELHAEMVRKFMIGAAARVLEPGCKLDTALVLQGDQGLRKSTFFSILGGEWFVDTYIDITNKDSILQLHAAWLYEFAEIENLIVGRASARVRGWMSSSHDTFRPPYQRAAIKKPRAVVICGTVNPQQFLNDETGSRRYWVIPVRRKIPFDLLTEMRDQLWAEAMCAAEAGDQFWLDDASDRARDIENRTFTEDDPWIQPIADWIAHPNVTEVSCTDLLATVLKVDLPHQDQRAKNRVARALRELGWGRVQRRRTGAASGVGTSAGDNRVWVYVPRTQSMSGAE
jgi:hypothetical protein